LQFYEERKPTMSGSIVEQVVTKWLSTYEQEHLKGFEGEVLEDERD